MKNSKRPFPKWKQANSKIRFDLFPYWKHPTGILRINRIIWRCPVFGNKGKKIQRLFEIGRRVRQAEDGLSQADLARDLDVSRGTIHKDLGIIEDKTGIMLAEDGDGRLHWFGRRR
jgi:hypothetical protein